MQMLVAAAVAATVLLLVVCADALPSVTVLTKNRPRSLARVVESVRDSEPRDAPIDLHICCDVPDYYERAAEDVRTYIANLRWTRGTYTYEIANTPQRLTKQWLGCAVAERAAILEDDIEIAPYALRWLEDAYSAYAADDEVAGFSLQRQTNCFHDACAQRTLAIPWTVREYKYVLVGTWGFAPVARHWHAFRAWYREHASHNESYVPNVDRILPSTWYRTFLATGRAHTMWSIWFMDYCNKQRLYTVYYRHPLPQTLAAHWGERGEHFDGRSPRRDFPLLPYDPTPVHRPALPELTTPRIWWDGRGIEHPSIATQTATIVAATQYVAATSGQTPLLTFVNDGFRNMTRHFFCNLDSTAPELLASLIVVVGDAESYDDLLRLRAGRSYAVHPLLLPQTRGTLLFGTRDYVYLLLVRTRLIAAIADRRVPLLMFECDAAVRENFELSFRTAAATSGADLVGIQDDTRDKGRQPNGGFMLMTNRTAVASMWRKVVGRFEREFASIPLNDTKRMKALNDQIILRQVLNEQPPAASIHLLDTRLYRSGQTLGDMSKAAEIDAARVVLFNFVIGNAAKRRNALLHRLWHYDERTEQCID